MARETILYEKAGPIAVLSCNQASPEAMQACLAALRDCQEDHQMRVLIWNHTSQASPAKQPSAAPWTAQIIEALQALPQIVLATVEGVACGPGLAFVLASDLALAASSATFRFGDAVQTDTPGSIIATLIRQTLGRRVATQLMLLNEPLSAVQALAHHIVQRVVPSEMLMEETWAWAERIAQLDPDLLHDIKRA